jgi:replication factor A1
MPFVMGRIEDLINTVSEKTGLQKGELRQRIREKQHELSGLVSEEGAAFIIANELGVKTQNRVIETAQMKIKDIMPDMRAVTTTGRIKFISEPREFTTKKGLKNKVCNLELYDETGSIRAVLWNASDIDQVENGNLKEGSIIQIKNGYIREGWKGGYEINLGNKGMVVINPDDVDTKEIPKKAPVIFSKISELKPGMNTTVAARITHNWGVREFDKNGNKGKVANVIVNDGTGGTRLVLWNEQADIIEKLEVGKIVKIENGFTKEGQRGIEIQANQGTKIKINPKGIKVPEIGEHADSQEIKISDLQDGDNYKAIRGMVTNIYGDNFVYDMCPNCNKKITGTCEKCGEVKPNKLTIVNTMIDDGTGTIRISLFRGAAEEMLGMKAEEIEASPDSVKSKIESLIGKEMLFEGRAKKNEQYERMEFNAFKVSISDPVEEAKKLLE